MTHTTKGTTWKEATGSVSAYNRFVLNEKRNIAITSDADMVLTGYGDIVVSETLTDAADVWSGQEQSAIMGNKGMIDLVLQIQEIDTIKKERKRFRNLSQIYDWSWNQDV